MVDILGADVGTFSRVIAAFFLGLAGGAWAASRLRTGRPWAAVAWAEGIVALLALVVLLVSQWGDFGQGHTAWAPWLRWLLPLALILPPAFAMGMVIPWMIRAAPPFLAVPLYAVNTLGGIAGLGLTLFCFLPALGLSGASFVALALNLVVAACAWMLSRRGTARESLAVEKSLENTSLNALAFASGFLVLAAEVVFQHQLAQLLISSYYSSAFVLTLVLASLGLSALLVPLASRLGTFMLPVALGASAIAFAIQPIVLVVQRGGLFYVPFEKTLSPYLLEALRLGVPAVFLVLIPAGLVFPLLLKKGVASGIDAGHLLAVNGLGGWFGAELAERVFLPMFGLWYVMAVLAAAYAVSILLCTGRTRWLLVPALGLFASWTWHLDARLPHVGLIKGDRVAEVAVGREGVVAVVTAAPDDWRIVVNNSYTLGGTRAQTNQERQALLPILLHGQAHDIATLGVATGSTLGGALMDPAVRHAEGIELSPLVLRFASAAPFNAQMAADPRVQLTRGDARWVIGQRKNRFDVIVGDLFLPWGTGEARLFTREHFEKVRAALKPGGLYCQWLPMYQLTQPEFEAIVRTFRQVFPEAWLVRGDFYTSMPIVGLIGGRSLTSLDWNQITAACERVRAEGLCRDPLLRHVEGVAMTVVGPAPEPPPGPAITLANSWLEWDAAHNVIGLRKPWFNGVPLAKHLRSAQQAAGNDFLPADLRSARECGELLNAFEIARATKLPQAAVVEEQLRITFPAAMGQDHAADWRHWPMRFPPDFLTASEPTSFFQNPKPENH